MSRPPVRGVVDGEPGRLAVPKLHCRGCGAPVPKGRRNWCGQVCIDDHLLRNNPATARAKTFERDRGVCALCGRDAEAIERRLREWLRADPYPYQRRSRRELLRRLGLIKLVDRTLWEMDHIVPVIEGGGGCGLDNLRTLCVPCHRAETRALAKRRAEQRRAAKAVTP